MTKRRQMTMDGNTAAAHVSYAFTDVAAIYPITPSSNMAEAIDAWSANGRTNIFGERVIVKEMQSEGGAAGALHGMLQGGSLASTYTASQGLLLMIPNMYKIAGELLPAVFHVSARSLASNALSIFGDHQDVMATRQTGFSLIASSSVQQAMDLAAVAHLSAIKSRIPVLHFFDGFRTSHEVQKIDVLEYDELESLVDKDAIKTFKNASLNPNRPVLRGTTQNPDVFFQTREAINKFYEPIPEIFEHYMNEINKLTDRDYQLFNYYGKKDAESMIIAMGSGCDAIKETIRYANNKGAKYGLLEVHLYRPFSSKHMLATIPASVKRICVLDRTKEPGAEGEPLYLDVRNAYYNVDNAPMIIGGRYGLGSKEFTPENVMEVYTNLDSANPKNLFTVGIVDDVTNLSLPAYPEHIDTTPKGTIACKFWGLGSDGTVSANKSAVKIIGDNTDKFCQAYFAYDSKKSGGLTVSHLRFGNNPIQSPYLITNADYIACHNQSYVYKYDLLDGIKNGGRLVLNCIWDKDQVEKYLPAKLKRDIANNNIEFYTINAVEIAKEIGLGHRINMIMQAAFFSITDVLPIETSAKLLKDAVVKSYGKKGQKIVDMNNAAIDAGISRVIKIDVPESWKNVKDTDQIDDSDLPVFVKNIVVPMNAQKGDDLPVSAFNGYEDGTYPLGITQYEKRGVAIEVPEWQANNCIQCNQCSFVCPHAVIRPMLLDNADLITAQDGIATLDATGFAEKKYHLAISAMDCTGCGNCVDVCPAKEKALVMKPLGENQEKYEALWNFVKDIEPANLTTKQTSNVKGSQFLKPLIEFSGACAGCGETPYAKLITQLYGDRMVISTSAGCATVWSGAAPSIPYTTNSKGHGPAWGFSLFEDNAEYGYGMQVGAKTMRETVVNRVNKMLKRNIDADLKEVMTDYVENYKIAEGTRERAEKLQAALVAHRGEDGVDAILDLKDYFIKQSNWIFGGDGWAYDIGYGGLDHVLASGEDVNIIVFDTEVYSNTGGQSSKATPTAATAKFAAAGKPTKKKDLGIMAVSYGYVYVAQISMGADKNQTLKAIREAEAYPGPSLIIAYAPCVNHGIKAGMGQAQQQMKNAVLSGYWSLYRYNPELKEQGKNPFILDSKEPTLSFRDHLLSEVRYTALAQQFPEAAEALFEKAEKDATERRETYKRMAAMNY